MYNQKILNPALLELLARFRHTNYLVICDRGFPYWPQVPTVDISLTDDCPTVRDVLKAMKGNLIIGNAWMAEQMKGANGDKAEAIEAEYLDYLGIDAISYEDHDAFKLRVPKAIGLIRTGDTTQYGNIILESA